MPATVYTFGIVSARLYKKTVLLRFFLPLCYNTEKFIEKKLLPSSRM